MKRLLKRRTFRWTVGAVVVLLAVVYVAVSYLIASGVTSAERKEQEDHPSAYGLEFEEVDFISRRGDVQLEGWYIPGDAAGPTLVFVHGIGGIRTGDNATELAARLVGRGFSILMFDLRAHGSSGGDKVSGGYHEQLDVLGAVDYLGTRGIEQGRVGVIGFSMGAGTSVLALAVEPAIRALVADSSYAVASELIARETARKTPFPEWLVPIFVPAAALFADLLFDIDLGALDPEEAVARIDYPILVIHGDADDRIPFEHGYRLHASAHPESALWLAPGSDHVDAFLDYPEEYVDRVAAYFETRLGGQ